MTNTNAYPNKGPTNPDDLLYLTRITEARTQGAADSHAKYAGLGLTDLGKYFQSANPAATGISLAGIGHSKFKVGERKEYRAIQADI